MSTLSESIASLLGVESNVIDLDGVFSTSLTHGALRYRWNLELDRLEFFHPEREEWEASQIAERPYFEKAIRPSAWGEIVRLREALRALLVAGWIPPQ